MKFKANQTDQKLRGGYYTPQNIADYVTKWVLEINPKNILEPSCGDGCFFQALHNNSASKEINITGFELFDTEVKKSKIKCEELGFRNYSIVEGDFLEWAEKKVSEKNQLFEGIIGNPPFIRYQFLDKAFQARTENIFKDLNLKFTKHTNAWVPFIIASISMLKKGGRLGMVIPSEIIHVMHAQSLRTYLSEECSKIVIVDPKEIWFSDTLQGAVILFAEKKMNESIETQGVSIKSVNGYEFLKLSPEELFFNAKTINGKIIKDKWTKATLELEEIELIDRIINHPSVYQFNELAKVEVGIVTGANDFFLVNDETVKIYGLANYAKPMFGRSQHCQGIIYNKEQHHLNSSAGLPTNFIYIEDNLEDLPLNIKQYIELGEKQDLHKRYKCKIRTPWYKVPSVFSSKLGMLKRAHDAPKLIFNELEAFTTDTIYRIELKDNKIEKEQFVYCFLNPLTAILAELEGRYYGGGVLELVPSEIRKLFIPIPDNLRFDIKELDELVKSISMTDILKMQGKKIFENLGFSSNEINKLLNIWIKLKNRRQRSEP